MVTSAGLLMYRKQHTSFEFFLIHPGGPFWAKKNEGVWSIPKGLVEPGESTLETAQREFFEETGIQPTPPFHDLGSVKTKAGKIIYAWAFKGSWDPAAGIKSNIISIEFPYGSGKSISIPEADKGAWMDFETAAKMLNASQLPLLKECANLGDKA